jgi:hypothetical protein
MEYGLGFCEEFLHLNISEQAAALGHDLTFGLKFYYLAFRQQIQEMSK